MSVCVCVHISCPQSPAHPHCRGQSPTILLQGKRLSSGLYLVHRVLTERHKEMKVRRDVEEEWD